MTHLLRKPNRVPGLLVSVRDASEAIEALAGGADVIDVKEPSAGPLGRATNEKLAAVLRAVAGRAPVTAALGELPGTDPRGLPAGLVAVKCGLAGTVRSDWAADLIRLGDRLPTATRLVPVAYADHAAAAAPMPDEVLAAAERLDAGWMVIDTWDKRAEDSLTLLGGEPIAELLTRASSRGISIVLAGRLTTARLAEAAALEPALVGVRGAACVGGRSGRVAAGRVRSLVDRLAAASRCQ